ncbi:MAG TPA: GNAT family N-acetyltransferase [Pyrinomonadaceae bacterium]|nr:GNAT family N-acetyltransferase [Pyrinomonadaceae bacterium]
MTIDVIAKKPSDCSPTELEDFERLVLAGGEVTAAGLNARIKNAAILIYVSQSNYVTGIAALKQPQEQYKKGVFQKAGATAQPNEFPLELGWIFVVPASRGAGLSHKLVEVALDASNGRGIFATSRADNAAMHCVLKAHGFSIHGHAYASDRNDHELVLFLWNAA